MRVPSGDHQYSMIGRGFSSVTGFADASASTGATQTFSTPSRGAIHASDLPSGESFGASRLGLPKISLRGMRSDDCATAVEAIGVVATRVTAATAYRALFTSISSLRMKCPGAARALARPVAS